MLYTSKSSSKSILVTQHVLLGLYGSASLCLLRILLGNDQGRTPIGSLASHCARQTFYHLPTLCKVPTPFLLNSPFSAISAQFFARMAQPFSSHTSKKARLDQVVLSQKPFCYTTPLKHRRFFQFFPKPCF